MKQKKIGISVSKLMVGEERSTNSKQLVKKLKNSRLPDKRSPSGTPRSSLRRRRDNKLSISSEETEAEIFRPPPQPIRKDVVDRPDRPSLRRKSVSFLIDDDKKDKPSEALRTFRSKRRGSLPDASCDFNKVLEEIESEKNCT
ncbi:unnamed protein product [Dimorphilus gyrociliatus]|uniref:Uncharacterized protein n=1 Tax=Dimorphilus gyrociliatus TaxID=2664684 RepID=A0A7I8VT57_9ANNE|nr:unnamed protein product [Dimorphilus gyrociliatus]